MDTHNLDLLPAGAARITDDALIAALAAAQWPGGWNAQLCMAALARYASPKALHRIRAIYESQQERCQPGSMAYFVRVDPTYVDRILQNDACSVQYFGLTPQIAMGPALERHMTASLMQGCFLLGDPGSRWMVVQPGHRRPRCRGDAERRG